MQALQLFQALPAEKKPLKLVEIAIPEPSAGQVRVQVKMCGVCHTDLHTVEGDIHPPEMPIIPAPVFPSEKF